MENTPSANVFGDHDHAGCQAHAIARAEAIIAEQGVRLTPVRRRVLEILLEEHRALGAYAVLDRLVEEGFARQPPVAYRALDFLVEHGLAHRIRRLNAYTACVEPGHDHPVTFLICENCETVAETSSDALGEAINDTAVPSGFKVSRVNLEAIGTCKSCREGAKA